MQFSVIIFPTQIGFKIKGGHHNLTSIKTIPYCLLSKNSRYQVKGALDTTAFRIDQTDLDSNHLNSVGSGFVASVAKEHRHKDTTAQSEFLRVIVIFREIFNLEILSASLTIFAAMKCTMNNPYWRGLIEFWLSL